MSKTRLKHRIVIAIAPSTRGFGFAVLEGRERLVDWGVRKVKGDKNSESLKYVEKLVAHYQPKVMVFQDVFTKGSRRSPRIRTLTQQIVALVSSRNVKVKLFSPQKLTRMYFAEGEGTKHARAEIIAKRFPEELSFRLPPKRRPWTPEDSRMDIFDAVALALAYFDSRQARGH